MWRGDTWVIGSVWVAGRQKRVEVELRDFAEERAPCFAPSNASLVRRAHAPQPLAPTSVRAAPRYSTRALSSCALMRPRMAHMTMHAGFGGTSTSSFSLTSSIIFACPRPARTPT